MDKPDWELNPENYATDPDGNFILKVDGTPRKKSGRAKGSKGRGYNFHSETKAKQAAKRTVRDKQKKIKHAQDKISRHKKSIETTNKALTCIQILPSLSPIPYQSQSNKPKLTANPIIGVVNLNNFFAIKINLNRSCKSIISELEGFGFFSAYSFSTRAIFTKIRGK